MMLLAGRGWSYILTVILLFLVLSPLTNAQPDYTPALKVGDSARYSVSGDQSENVTESVLTVTSIVGANVTIDFVDHYKDGSPPESYQYSLDVKTGSLRGPPDFYYAIAGGLGPGDQLYSGSPLHINRTQTLRYAGADRLVNVLTLSSANRTRNFYWDASTGLLSEVFFTSVSGTQVKLDVNARITSTNAWEATPPTTPPQGPDIASSAVVWLVSFVPAVLILFALVVRRRWKRREKA